MIYAEKKHKYSVRFLSGRGCWGVYMSRISVVFKGLIRLI